MFGITGLPLFCVPDTQTFSQPFALLIVTVVRWGQGGIGPQILPRPPKFSDKVVLLLVELTGSIVNFA